MKTISLKLGGPVPDTIGRCADAYHDVKELRLAMDKEVKAIKERETELYNHIVDNLSVSEDTGASGKRYKAQITTSEEPTVTDWEALHDYVYEEDRFDLLGKSIAKGAVKEMQAEGVTLPGVTKITVKKVSITKI